ncbi:hypothetical protein SLS62_006034 [Diatrype stigma]|uniref:Uncharacterized protein n=1 Tax=Diatrype stigma TaxID=117547 RepID=A0AAN9UQK8_9PEZI
MSFESPRKTATAIATGQPDLIVLAGRHLSKVQETADALKETSTKVRGLQLELISQRAVRAAANAIDAWDDVPRSY